MLKSRPVGFSSFSTTFVWAYLGGSFTNSIQPNECFTVIKLYENTTKFNATPPRNFEHRNCFMAAYGPLCWLSLTVILILYVVISCILLRFTLYIANQRLYRYTLTSPAVISLLSRLLDSPVSLAIADR